MNLETLFNKLQEAGRIKPSRLAHIRMSVRHYAAALGCPSPEDCSCEVYAIDEQTRNQFIEEYFKGGKSAYLLRNTKNDISFLFRQAEELKLIELPDPIIEGEDGDFGKRKLGRALPRKVLPKQTGFHRQSYGLPFEDWSDELREQYEDWRRWVSTDRKVAGNINPYNRPATIENKTRKFESYFGYLFKIKHIDDLDFQMLTDTRMLEDFAEWHLKRNNEEVSSQVSAVLSIAASIAQKYYFPKAILADRYFDTEKYKEIALEITRLQRRFNSNLKTNTSDSQKKEVYIPAQDLRRAARQEFPDKTLLDNQSGTVLALNAGRALAIMLIVNYPLRNINYREARLSQNIYKNAGGEWILRFTGDEGAASLKTKKRLHENNIYERIIEPETAELLDNYLRQWRPLLLRQVDEKIEQIENKENSSDNRLQVLKEHQEYLFLNSTGVPFSRQSFSTWIEKGIYRWFGVRISPERIRRISAIEMLNQGKSTSQVAEQLNDAPASISRIRRNYP